MRECVARNLAAANVQGQRYSAVLMSDDGRSVLIPASMFAALRRAQRSTRRMGIPASHPLNDALQRCLALPGAISLAPTLEDVKARQLVPVVAIEGKIGTDTDCPVCLQPFGEEDCCKTRCGHAFHRVCVEKWVDHQHAVCQRERKAVEASCPVCRTTL